MIYILKLDNTAADTLSRLLNDDLPVDPAPHEF
jgi:hypothetical protein